jgi:hypothetical protein
VKFNLHGKSKLPSATHVAEAADGGTKPPRLVALEKWDFSEWNK